MRGWSNPNSAVAPTITGLSTNISHATLLTIVAIVGTNFRPYSSIRFGTYKPDLIFVNSEHIEFYVPLIVTKPATYTVQVFNGNNGSNVVTYDIDDALNYWILNNSKQIYNSNDNGLLIKGITNVEDNMNCYKNLSVQETITGKNIRGDTVLTTSDYRIKDVIEPLNINYTVDNLNPIKYYNKLTGNTEIGLIAHELQKVYPYLVSGNKDKPDFQAINYTGLIGILIQEIQQLKKEINLLKQQP